MSSRRLRGGSSRRLSALFLVVVLPPAATLVWLGLQLVEQDRSLWAQRELEGRQAAAEAIVYSLNQSLADAERHLPDGEVPPGAVRFVMSPQRVEAHPPTRLLWLPTLPVMPAAEAAPFTEAEIFEFQGGGAEGALAVYEELGHSTSPAVRAGALVRVARVHRRERRVERCVNGVSPPRGDQRDCHLRHPGGLAGPPGHLPATLPSGHRREDRGSGGGGFPARRQRGALGNNRRDRFVDDDAPR